MDALQVTLSNLEETLKGARTGRSWRGFRDHLVVYASGHWRENEKLGGAGVFCKMHSAYIPVPASPTGQADGLRAQLYAALCALSIHKRHDTLVVVKLDCLTAILLLEFVMTLCMPPSRWVHERAIDAACLGVPLPGGGILTRDTLLNYADVLDDWFIVCTNDTFHVELEWLPLQVEHRLWQVCTDGQPEDREGNRQANLLARAGSTRFAHEDVSMFENRFPLHHHHRHPPDECRERYAQRR